MKKTEVLLGLLVLIIIVLPTVVSAIQTINLKSATHEKTTNVTEIFELDDTYYLCDMKDDKKILYLNFTDTLTNNSTLNIYAKKDKGITVGIYALSDINGTNPLGNFTVTSTTGEWYNTTLTNFIEPTNAIWLGDGIIGSGIDPREYFDYIIATNINETQEQDTTPPSTVLNLINTSQGIYSIYWTWTNPIDSDFSENIIYLDDINILNTSNNFYNATSLQEDTEYTIKINTIDINNNINNTNTTNTARTLKNSTEENNNDSGGGGSSGGGNSGGGGGTSGPSTVYQTEASIPSTPKATETKPSSNINSNKNINQPKTEEKSQEKITSSIIREPIIFSENFRYLLTGIIFMILAAYIYKKEVNKKEPFFK